MFPPSVPNNRPRVRPITCLGSGPAFGDASLDAALDSDQSRWICSLTFSSRQPPLGDLLQRGILGPVVRHSRVARSRAAAELDAFADTSSSFTCSATAALTFSWKTATKLPCAPATSSRSRTEIRTSSAAAARPADRSAGGAPGARWPRGSSSRRGAAVREPSRFICGFLACEPRLARSFLDGLPPLIVVNVKDDPAGQWLENSLRFSVAEACRHEPAPRHADEAV